MIFSGRSVNLSVQNQWSQLFLLVIHRVYRAIKALEQINSRLSSIIYRMEDSCTTQSELYPAFAIDFPLSCKATSIVRLILPLVDRRITILVQFLSLMIMCPVVRRFRFTQNLFCRFDIQQSLLMCLRSY